MCEYYIWCECDQVWWFECEFKCLRLLDVVRKRCLHFHCTWSCWRQWAKGYGWWELEWCIFLLLWDSEYLYNNPLPFFFLSNRESFGLWSLGSDPFFPFGKWALPVVILLYLVSLFIYMWVNPHYGFSMIRVFHVNLVFYCVWCWMYLCFICLHYTDD